MTQSCVLVWEVGNARDYLVSVHGPFETRADATGWRDRQPQSGLRFDVVLLAPATEDVEDEL